MTCPYCEEQTEMIPVDDFFIDHYLITVYECLICGERETDEPDWDSMKGGKDYD